MGLRLQVECLSLALLTGASAAFAQGSAHTPVVENTPVFASSTRLDRFGSVVAPVTINGRGPFRLVVDTGASRSTFSPRLAAELGLSPSFDSPLVMNGVTGTAEVPTVRVERIQAGDVVMERKQVPVVWSSIMAGRRRNTWRCGPARGTHPRGFSARQDRHHALAQSHRYEGLPEDPGRRLVGGLLEVEAKVGGVPTRVGIDTGAERSLGSLALRNALRNAALKRGREGRGADTQVFGATDQVAQGQSPIAPTIRLGQATINGTEIVFGDFHIFNMWNMKKRPAALIGMDVLGTVEALILDFHERELYADVTKPPEDWRRRSIASKVE